MASSTAVATVLATLQELYPNRDITENTGRVWAMAFADWSDEDLTSCAMRAAMTAGRTFFPTPGEIAAMRAPAPAIDTDKLLRQVSALGRQNPGHGWLYPNLGTITDALGKDVADAYAAAGGDRCFADDETGRAIARAAFAKELRAAARNNPTGRPALRASEGSALLTRGST